ncbi:MAG: hypothetical protein IPK67_04675 [Planctomycetes bacterium]|nr:hypothetical protein [Planctomycetota bacterium]
MEPKSERPNNPLAIKTPCPKKWEELTGAGARRFCSECSLHVIDAAALREREARELVAQSPERVCMRLEYDSAGRLRFLDSPAEIGPPPPASRRHPLVRWAVSAAAGLLAACQGEVSRPAPPAGGEPAVGPSRMGEANTVELGDVALPPTPAEIMGKVGPAAPEGQRPPAEKDPAGTPEH